MAVRFIGTTSGRAINGGNVTLTLPGAYTSGDCAIVTVALGTGTATTLSVASSSGATTLYTQIIATIQSSNVRFGVFRRIIGSTAETQITITGTGGSTDSTTGACQIFDGVDNTTPEDVAATSTTGASSRADSPLITPASFGCAIISAVGLGTPISATLAAPSSFLNAQSTTASDTRPVTIGQAWIPNGSTSAFNPAAWSSSVSQTWVSGTIALRPAAITWSEASWTSADEIITESQRIVARSY